MREVLPNVYHWTRMHPKIHHAVSSYYLADDAVLIDPMVPDEGLDWFAKPPRDIILTNRHHYRDSGQFVERFGSRVWCEESGLHEFTHGEQVTAFHFNDDIAGGIFGLEIGAICPDETALQIVKGDGLIAVGDGVIRDGDGPLSFVPDQYMGDDPDAVKQGLREAFREVLERPFEHLLLAHGNPWIGGGQQALRDFVGS